MKKVFLALTISCALTVAHGQTTVYHPFPDSNAIWNEGCTYLTGNPPVPVTDVKFFFLAGDTIIGSTTYKKVLSSGYKYYLSTCCYYFNQYECAIRQDTTQRKIYYYGSMSNYTDSLLYDFANLILGDTLPATLIQGLSSNYISSIDSILIGSSYRKQYHISISGSTNPQDSNYVQLIEGIGGTFGLFIPFGGPPFEGGCSLGCYSENNMSLYINPNSTCDMTFGILNDNKQESEFMISPNPFSTQTTLQTDNPLHNATLTVYNSYGQQVKQFVISRNEFGTGSNSDSFVIRRDNLPSGLYFIHLTENDKTFATEKLVITDR